MAQEKISQNEIEALLNQTSGGAQAAGGADAPAAASDGDADVTSPHVASPGSASHTGTDSSQTPLLSVAAAPPSSGPASSPRDSIPQGDVEALLNQAQEALASVDRAAESLPPGVKHFEFNSLSGALASNEEATLDLIQDVELDLKIELGRTRMLLEQVLQLKRGSIVPLDKLAGDPVEVFVNGRLIARGEVLVLNDNFCIRVAELIAGESSA